MANENMKYLAVVAMIAIFVVGIGAGMFLNSANGTSTSEPYHLTLVITDNNTFNSSVGSQPAYFVLQNGVMMSSANIHVPLNKKIELTIMNYDDGADNGTPSALSQVVTGTGNNTMLSITDDTMNASYDANHVELNDEASFISNVPTQDMSHTFTVKDNSAQHNVILNIPIEASTTVTAIVMFSQAGTFHWQCYVPCGSGASGWAGAMSTDGWMSGNVIVA